jgi:sporulation protein YlmC with PRC-barrel domain
MKTLKYAYAMAVIIGLSSAAAQAETNGTSRSDRELGQLEKWSKLKGREIVGTDNQKLGKIEDAVVDLTSGHILYAIVGSGGIGPIGEKRYAVAPGAVSEVGTDNIHFNGDKAKLQAAPEFTKDMDKDTELGKIALIKTTHQHFGQFAWWEGKAVAADFPNARKASDLMNKNVKNVNDEDIAKVDNLMFNLPAGRVAFVVISPDSKLDLGSNLYALPPDAFAMNKDGKSLTSDISKDKLAGAPHFDKNNWAQASDPAWAGQVYQYYGKQAYFQSSGNLRPTGRSTDKTNKN